MESMELYARHILERVMSRKRYTASIRLELEEALTDILDHSSNPKSPSGLAFGKRLEGLRPMLLPRAEGDSATPRKYTKRLRGNSK